MNKCLPYISPSVNTGDKKKKRFKSKIQSMVPSEKETTI